MGDGGSAGDPGNRAQNMNQRLGKLLRIDPLRRGAKWQIVGLGLRNPWRFSFDRANGDLYIGDVGQGSWEEIDYRPRAQISSLANYGWKAFEGRARYSNTALGPGQLVAPVYVYSHDEGNCSVTGGLRVPRSGRGGGGRPLLLRRLLLRDRLEPARAGRAVRPTCGASPSACLR